MSLRLLALPRLGSQFCQRRSVSLLHAKPAALRTAATPILASIHRRPFSWTWPAHDTPKLSSSSSTGAPKPSSTPHTVPVSKPAESTNTPSTPATEEGSPVQTRENIYTIPNALTVSRILACPVIGYAILHDQYYLSTSLLAYAAISDALDGFIARRYNMGSVLGTILDPAADKTLMTTLTVTLAMQGLLPVPLAVIILGRDVLLSLSAFYIRYTSLPEPKTFSRYWDFSIPSAEVRPTQISKANTALQLLLMLATAVSPIIPAAAAAAYVHTPLAGLQWIVAGTTIWSGLGYVFGKDTVRIVGRATKKP